MDGLRQKGMRNFLDGDGFRQIDATASVTVHSEALFLDHGVARREGDVVSSASVLGNFKHRLAEPTVQPVADLQHNPPEHLTCVQATASRLDSQY